MDALVCIKNERIVTDSRTVADVFDKRHDHVLRDIDKMRKDLPNFGEMFAEAKEPDSYGRDRRVFYLNRDGFTLLAMGFTGTKAMQWKVKYIDAFNRMEEELKRRHQDSYMIADPVERAKKWIEEETIREKQAQQIEEMKPKALELGLFKVKETVINHSDGSISVSKTVKVTGKGQLYFVNKFLQAKSAQRLA